MNAHLTIVLLMRLTCLKLSNRATCYRKGIAHSYFSKSLKAVVIDVIVGAGTDCYIRYFKSPQNASYKHGAY